MAKSTIYQGQINIYKIYISCLFLQSDVTVAPEPQSSLKRVQRKGVAAGVVLVASQQWSRLRLSHACPSKAAAGESICLGFYCPGLLTQAIIDDSGKVSKTTKAVTDI